MFNKGNDTNIKKIEWNKKNFYKQYDNIFITPFFAIMINKYYEDKKMEEHLDFDERVKSYIDKNFLYGVKKQYNNAFTNLYHNGKIIINNQEFQLKNFYIVYKENQNNFHLLCTDPKYQNKNIEYNHAVKLIDTTAFIALIKNNNINNNTIIIDNNLELDSIIHNWNGLLHDQVSETDAINNKEMIRVDQNE